MIIAHRGASGYRPEHTRPAYELAYRMGADWVDVDLVATADGHLLARHENEIGRTTDVAEHAEFADRHRSRVIDGAELTGWFTEDFTLAELKTLRARERIPGLRQNNTLYDGYYELLTLDEVLEFIEQLGTTLGRQLGIAPEVKHPAYFASLGLPIEPELVRALRARGLDTAGAPVLIQSFEQQCLRTLREQLDVALLQLVQTDEFRVAEIVEYAAYIGPEKKLVIERDGDGNLGAPTSLVADAHAEGLRVAPWTFRNENAFLPTDLRSTSDGASSGGASSGDASYGNAFAEYAAYHRAGIDALFTDNPDTALAAQACWPAT